MAVAYLSYGLSQGRQRGGVVLYERDETQLLRAAGQTGHHGEGVLQHTAGLPALSLVPDQLLKTDTANK